MTNGNPFRDENRSSSIGYFLEAMRVQQGWEEEKLFRTVFERFVFDMGIDPEVAETKTLKVIEIIGKHKSTTDQECPTSTESPWTSNH